MAMQRYDAAIAGLGGVNRRPVMRKSTAGEFVKLSDVLTAIDLAIEIQEEMDYKLGLVDTSKHCKHAVKLLRKLRAEIANAE